MWIELVAIEASSANQKAGQYAGKLMGLRGKSKARPPKSSNSFRLRQKTDYVAEPHFAVELAER